MLIYSHRKKALQKQVNLLRARGPSESPIRCDLVMEGFDCVLQILAKQENTLDRVVVQSSALEKPEYVLSRVSTFNMSIPLSIHQDIGGMLDVIVALKSANGYEFLLLIG